jgi:hypothetical protein
MTDQLGLWIGFVLTLMVFSYLLGDNILYRLAVYVFVGLAAGFVTIVTVESVLLPWIRAALAAGGIDSLILGFLPLLLGVLLLFKSTRRLSRLGNLALALIVGVGAAVALVGAVSGTLLPLAASTSAPAADDALNGFLIVVGVISTLVYFQYAARRTASGAVQRGMVIRTVSAVGQGFIVVTLGALYGGAILTGLVVFSERIAFLLARISGG